MENNNNNNNPLSSIMASQLKGITLDKPTEDSKLDDLSNNDNSDQNEPTLEDSVPDFIKNLIGKTNQSDNSDNSDNSNNDDNSVNSDNTDKPNENISAIENLITEWGIDPTELEGFDLKSNNLEDIKKVISKREEIVRKDTINTFRPEVQALHEHLESGKGMESWNRKQESINWTAIQQNLKEDDIATQEQIVRNGLQNSGLKDVVIKATIESLKDEDSLYTAAIDFVNQFDAADKAELKQIEDAEIAMNLANKSDIEKVVTQVSNIIKSGTFKLSDNHSFSIPETERKEFLETVLTPERKNALYDSLSYDQALALDYIATKIKAGKIGDIKFGTVVKPTVIVKSSNPIKVTGNESTGGEMSLERLREKFKKR